MSEDNHADDCYGDLAFLLEELIGRLTDSRYPNYYAFDMASDIMRSDWLREHSEFTWDEGFADGRRQDAEGDDGPRFVNPYRVEGRA